MGVVGRNHGRSPSLCKKTNMWPVFTDPLKISHVGNLARASTIYLFDRHVKSTTVWYKVHFILCISRSRYIDVLNKIDYPWKLW
jgi:hypothetical protein